MPLIKVLYTVSIPGDVVFLHVAGLLILFQFLTFIFQGVVNKSKAMTVRDVKRAAASRVEQRAANKLTDIPLGPQNPPNQVLVYW